MFLRVCHKSFKESASQLPKYTDTQRDTIKKVPKICLKISGDYIHNEQKASCKLAS